ncbi:SGNH/GDSL hydrolase family protein [Sulfoacidibacillus thermotolerans]|uniref:SGNH hydrolase-type esterase domain-containing protein n=1 Tax=Sulfoacidibacillus thermotolerans TaxID=1765684 RepID=A0A2U3DBJ6_SULT2|nr:SGNH/GDSL hydrolase family protein [Sulfoacidibacillus thermotolerans]PWI58658.1 hypothetical protein BM613_00730 [Sulfoacidibacillus thermotolerans]
MIYLALGDSITYGYDASDDNHRFVTVLTKKLNQIVRTSVHLHAKPGWTSSQLLRSLEKIPQCILDEAALISLMIGGNDLIKVMPWYLDNAKTASERLRKSFYPQVLEIVDRVKCNDEVVVMICTVYNPFPKSDIAQQALADLNALLREIAQQRGCVLVPIDEWYGGSEEQFVKGYRRGELQDFRLVRNPIHPNDAGHERIAEAIFASYLQIYNQRMGTKSSRSKPLLIKKKKEDAMYVDKKRTHGKAARVQRRLKRRKSVSSV